MKIFKKEIWKTIPFLLSAILVVVTPIISLLRNDILYVIIAIFLLLGNLRNLWYIGIDDKGLYRFSIFKKSPYDLFLYEDIDQIAFIKILWTKTLVIHNINGTKKYCGLAMMNKKLI